MRSAVLQAPGDFMGDRESNLCKSIYSLLTNLSFKQIQ